VTAANQFGLPNQTDVWVVANNGATVVSWVVGAGDWNGPLRITPPGLAAPGVGLTSSNQFGLPNQTNAWVIAKSGAINVSWVVLAGAWQGPLVI
jgi:hypothetical protein